MARWTEPTSKQERTWAKWVKSRPPAVRAMAERLPPWELYRMKSTGQRVTVYSFSEGGTVTALVSGQFNAVLFETSVFGIDPNDLEPCDLPQAGEPLGSMMTDQEAEDNRDALRVMIRPDLFVMGADGKAQRKS